jgi:ribonuclease E
MSLIGRTAGIGRSVEELQWDLNYLLQLWTAIDGAAKGQTGAFLIYQESSLVIRAIRDYFTPISASCSSTNRPSANRPSSSWPT